MDLFIKTGEKTFTHTKRNEATQAESSFSQSLLPYLASSRRPAAPDRDKSSSHLQFEDGQGSRDS